MISNHDMNTGPLWSLLKTLLFFSVLCIVGSLIYFPLSDNIKEWSQGYDKTELAKRTADRADAYDSGPQIMDGIDVQTGMVYDENFKVVKATCTSCHSSKLIIQNRATREGWKDMIVWMQETQGLPDLGTLEPKVLGLSCCALCT